MRRKLLKSLLALGAATLAAGCGFQLRGQAQLPFTTAYVEAGGGSNLAKSLRATLSSQGKLADKAEDAPVRIRLGNEQRSKNILALSGSGKVKEYRLEYRVTLSAYDAAGKELIVPSEIQLIRDFSYDDQQLLAKETEEAALNRGMEQDALRQILKRLSYLQR